MDNTEKRLRVLFDFQRFSGSKRLKDVIRTAGLPGNELSDDELDLNAAGEAEAWRSLPGDEEKP